MSFKKIISIWIVTLAFALAMIKLGLSFENFQTKGRDSEGKHHLISLIAAQKAYYESFGKYSHSVFDLQFVIDNTTSDYGLVMPYYDCSGEKIKVGPSPSGTGQVPKSSTGKGIMKFLSKKTCPKDFPQSFEAFALREDGDSLILFKTDSSQQIKRIELPNSLEAFGVLKDWLANPN